MAASKKSLEKIKDLEAKRRHDSDAKREWERLIQEYDQQNFNPTPADPKGPELQALVVSLAEFLDGRDKKGDDNLDDCCGHGARHSDYGLSRAEKSLAGIDLENLAERVFERLIFEVRIERERVGRSA